MNKIYYKKGYKYWLAGPYSIYIPIFHKKTIISSGRFVELSQDGVLSIKAGYAWDGPSGPTFDTKTFMRGSLVHDALCQLICEGLLDPRYVKEANTLLHKMCLEDGMGKVRAWLVYKAVNMFCSIVMTKKNVLSAP